MATASELPKLYQGVQKQSFGYKMLATMGWEEGQGLGANNQGIKEHIKVKKKQDAFGVGAAEQAHKMRDWTTGMVGYDAILSGLKEITRGSAPPDSSSSDDSDSGAHSSGYDSDSDTSGDAAAARAAAKKKQKAKKGKGSSKKQKGSNAAAAAEAKDSSSKKKKRKQDDAAAAAGKPKKRSKKEDSSSSDDASSSDSDSDSDGAPAAATAAAAAGAAALSTVSRVKAATHVGRYAKRERAKTVRNYSATDLAAILGLPSSAPAVEGGEGADAWAAAAAVGARNARQASSSSGSDSDDESSSGSDSDDSSDSGSREGSEQRLRPGTPEGSDTPPSRAEQGSEQDAKTLGLGAQNLGEGPGQGADSNAWWRNLFVKSGGSGSSIGMKVAGKAGINAHGFLEDDQTNLYMQAHANKTTGKQGLGRSSMPKKVAGARWQGTKTKLGSDDEEDEQAQQQQQQQHEAAVDSIAAAAAASGREQYVKNGILIVLPLKKRPAQQQQQQQQQQEEKKQGKKDKESKKAKKNVADASAEQQQEQPAAAGKKRKQQDQAAAAAAPQASSKKAKKAAAAAAAAAEQPQKSVKWAKLAAKVLEGAPKRRMRIQKLHKQVVAAAGFDVDAPGVDAEALYQQMLEKLRKADGLQVCEKYVGLAQA